MNAPSTQVPPIQESHALYVHVPFCETKCGYCDFYSVPLRGRNTAPLVQRVCRELRTRVTSGGYAIHTVFCGGGTPTLLPTSVLAELLGVVNEVAPVDRLGEFTVEANPATVEEEKANLLVRSGVNRVSMGAQSFLEAELAALERLHSPNDIAPSVETLRRCGVSQINLDLIFGIPGQTVETWTQSLHRAIDLNVDHIACYGLTYEPGTAMTARKKIGQVIPCDEQLEADLYLSAIDTLDEAGYAQYEISNFARPGRESKHNLVYWRNEPYIGVGPSAAGCYQYCDREGAGEAEGTEARRHEGTKEETSKRQNVETSKPPSEPGAQATGQRPRAGAWSSDAQSAIPSAPNSQFGTRRYKNVADVSRYIRLMDTQGHAEMEHETLDTEAAVLETILMQLRLNEGLSIGSFQRRIGIDPRTLFNGALDRLADQGLLTVSDQSIVLTRQGRLVANTVMTDLAAAM